jgi:prepilin-type N-terminal cleavage/methylation domain-containing protein
MPRNAHRSSERAFSLVELMTVVVIVGILATLATYGVRKYVMEAKKAEASSMLVQIRAAEEAYKDETFEYDGLANFDNWHPTNTPDPGKRGWQSGSTPMTAVMNRLGVMPDGPVTYSYAVVARTSGSAPGIPTVKTWDFPDATGPFYIAMAKADLNGDGVFTYALSHSDTAEIYVDDTF